MDIEYDSDIKFQNLDAVLKDIEDKYKNEAGIYIFTVPGNQDEEHNQLKKDWKEFKNKMQKRAVSKEDFCKILQENEEPYDIQKVFNVKSVPGVNKSWDAKEISYLQEDRIALYLGKHEK